MKMMLRFSFWAAGAQEEGPSFGEAVEPLDQAGAAEALEDWNMAVVASVMRYSPSTSKGR